MTTNTSPAEPTTTRAWLSTLWIFVLLNMIFADIYSFLSPGFLQGVMAGLAEGRSITPELLLVAAVVNEVPIAMVALARALPLRANRRANIIAAIVTVAFVIGGGSLTPHYLFFAAIEVAALLFIIWTAWTWREAAHHPRAISSSYAG